MRWGQEAIRVGFGISSLLAGFGDKGLGGQGETAIGFINFVQTPCPHVPLSKQMRENSTHPNGIGAGRA
ncbi:MAG TPA: hypothetical protein V6D09_20090 [Leptolyngbyaceae cyanobacterium]